MHTGTVTSNILTMTIVIYSYNAPPIADGVTEVAIYSRGRVHGPDLFWRAPKSIRLGNGTIISARHRHVHIVFIIPSYMTEEAKIIYRV